MMLDNSIQNVIKQDLAPLPELSHAAFVLGNYHEVFNYLTLFKWFYYHLQFRNCLTGQYGLIIDPLCFIIQPSLLATHSKSSEP